jgi:hypothetical protein
VAEEEMNKIYEKNGEISAKDVMKDKDKLQDKPEEKKAKKEKSKGAANEKEKEKIDDSSEVIEFYEKATRGKGEEAPVDE